MASRETPRGGHEATQLLDGRVLVTGGADGTLSAEIYDFEIDAWESAGEMFTERKDHTSSRIADGRVVIAGGRSFVPVSYTEIFDPSVSAGQSWARTDNLSGPRESHSATVLPDGNILVVGGKGGMFTDITRVELYDPFAGSWGSRGSMDKARWGHSIFELPGGAISVSYTHLTLPTNREV